MAYDDAGIVTEYFKSERIKAHTLGNTHKNGGSVSVSTRYLNSLCHKRSGVYNVKLTNTAA
jgi:hypothetical protein